jgi:AcrR family transcriptional regulator
MQRARSQQDKETRRVALLDAALDVFFERGFAATRMEDVARRAGLSKGTLYLYFESKEQLFEALIEELATPRLQQLESLSTNAASLSEALELIAAFAPQMIGSSKMPKLMKILIGESHVFPHIVRRYRTEKIDRVLGSVSSLLDNAAARGEIPPLNAALTARLVVAPIIYSALWEAVFGNDDDPTVDLKELFGMHTRFLSRALGLPEALP